MASLYEDEKARIAQSCGKDEKVDVSSYAHLYTVEHGKWLFKDTEGALALILSDRGGLLRLQDVETLEVLFELPLSGKTEYRCQENAAHFHYCGKGGTMWGFSFTDLTEATQFFHAVQSWIHTQLTQGPVAEPRRCVRSEASTSRETLESTPSLPLLVAPNSSNDLSTLPTEPAGGLTTRLQEADMPWDPLVYGEPARTDAAARRIQRQLRPFLERRREERRRERRKRARMEIVKELLSTEQAYVANLEILKIVWKDPLLDAVNKGRPILTAEQVRTVFSELDPILMFNTDFLNNVLQPRIQNWDNATSLIGDAFLGIYQYLKMYTAYVRGYHEALIVLNHQTRKNSDFRKFLETQAGIHQAVLRRLDLNSFLILPIQRIPRYQLLLKDLKKHTSEDHPDFDNLVNALAKIEEVAHYVNEKKREAETMQGVLEVQEKVVGISKFGNLVTPQRRFLREGMLEEASRPKPDDPYKRSVRALYLFNDLIVLAKPVKKMLSGEGFQFKFSDALNLRSVDYQVWSFPREDALEDGVPDGIQHAFEISCSYHSFIFCANGEEEKNSWIDDICSSIKELKDRKTQHDADVKKVVQTKAAANLSKLEDGFRTLEKKVKLKERERERLERAKVATIGAPRLAAARANLSELEKRYSTLVRERDKQDEGNESRPPSAVSSSGSQRSVVGYEVEEGTEKFHKFVDHMHTSTGTGEGGEGALRKFAERRSERVRIQTKPSPPLPSQSSKHHSVSIAGAQTLPVQAGREFNAFMKEIQQRAQEKRLSQSHEDIPEALRSSTEKRTKEKEKEAEKDKKGGKKRDGGEKRGFFRSLKLGRDTKTEIAKARDEEQRQAREAERGREKQRALNTSPRDPPRSRSPRKDESEVHESVPPLFGSVLGELRLKQQGRPSPEPDGLSATDVQDDVRNGE